MVSKRMDGSHCVREETTARELRSAKSAKHRLSDRKWRASVNSRFAVLDTIASDGRHKRRAKDDGKSSTSGGKRLAAANKRVPKRKKRAPIIDVLQSTVDLISDHESAIENRLNEITMARMAKSEESVVSSPPPIVSTNGLEKIRNIFEFFEKKREMEVKGVPTVPLVVDDTKPLIKPLIKPLVVCQPIGEKIVDHTKTVDVVLSEVDAKTLVSSMDQICDDVLSKAIKECIQNPLIESMVDRSGINDDNDGNLSLKTELSFLNTNYFNEYNNNTVNEMLESDDNKEIILELTEYLATNLPQTSLVDN